MKLVIQIPCYNEEESLPLTLAELPRQIPGIDAVEWLIIDDGSRDRTVEVARKLGVEHVVSFPRNRGLAKGFMAGINRALEVGADVIVNTDADNQYCAADIEKLVQPIVEGRADYVIGARPIKDTAHFSATKKFLQKLGSWVVRVASDTDVPDAPSGFRAMTRDCAMRLNVFSEYTYTLETIIQSGQLGMAVTSVPIRTNKDLRPSRLLKSIPNYINKSIGTILRIFMAYKPLRFFGVPGAISFALGFLLGLRFLYFYLTEGGGGHIQSVILSALLMGIGIFLVIVGLLADLISVNRKLLEKIDWRVHGLHLEQRDMATRIESQAGKPSAPE